ncbi:dihydroorotate dehydrogenase [Parasphaerochaeta coccoides]|uniref:Dihydroorotate dehydrogenase family protein n=1 Tax=Parasphaerochaeta coccoides (strain ATCC BAA-1237 / DSM 17374 / SPN1) TaxID=760011 RepID=F4GJI3_PARC1|nr:dihydroorotate dehydrogenase [Parasphaerochaeta coccoides]AEC02248.1 dihydroorotate dehydrogenase family protein [Parasphaerochaeta coccoides DSM 17374]
MMHDSMKPSLKAYLTGRHERSRNAPHETPVALTTVSGVATTQPGLIAWCDREIPDFAILTTKSFQVAPNPGNPEPVICETIPGNFGNSVGLRNPGMTVALEQLRELRKRHSLRAYLLVSLSASNPDDFITLVKAFDGVCDGIELNFSCPHASSGYGSSIGCDPHIASSYVRAIRENTALIHPLFIKLTPNVEDIGIVARSVMEAGADGLTAINTVGPWMHTDPVSGTPILQNALGGKGGASGKWVRARALECVREIRQAVGQHVPLIGMGGATYGTDVAAFIEAGADAVGLGSVLGRVEQAAWPMFVSSVRQTATTVLAGKQSAHQSTNQSTPPVQHMPEKDMVRQERGMAYVRHIVLSKVMYDEATAVITLDGHLECQSGQFTFLWLPGIGEKPFSVAESEPFTFIIKVRGKVSAALVALESGDSVYVRGVYGASLTIPRTDDALLIAGGTGVAVLPDMTRRLAQQGTRIRILTGTTSTVSKGTPALLEAELSQYGEFTCVPDDGVPARVLDYVEKHVETSVPTEVFIIGPEKFMARAARLMLSRGIGAEHIHLSMEKLTLCGIGMCGACVCGERLTCQYGTFMTYDYLLKEMPEFL